MGCNTSSNRETHDTIETKSRKYLENIFELLQNCEDFNIHVYSFVLLDKLGIKLESLVLNKSLYYAICCISDKMINDEPWINQYWAIQAGLNIFEFNYLEKCSLEELEYSTQVSFEEFDKMKKKICYLYDK